MRGISPIVSVTLLIALAVIVTGGLYFWVAGENMHTNAPQTDVTEISVVATDASAGEYLVTNVDTGYFTASALHTNNGTMTGDCSFGGSVTVAPGESVNCTIAGAVKPVGEITFYTDSIGPATIIVS